MLMSVSRTRVPTEACARTHTAPTSVTALWVSVGRCVNSVSKFAMNLSPPLGTLAWRRLLESWSSYPAYFSWSSSSSSSARGRAASQRLTMKTNIPEAQMCLTPSSRGLTLTASSARTFIQTSHLRSPCGPSPTLPAFQATHETTWIETLLRDQPSQSIQSSAPSTLTLYTGTAKL